MILGGIALSMICSAAAPILSLSLDFKGSGLLIIGLAALSIVWSFLSYRTTIPPSKLPLRLLLGSLRAFALLLIIFIIFEPAVQWRRQTTLKPLLAVLVDDSQSMRNRDSSGDRSRQLATLIRDPAWKNLGDRFDLRFYAFGDTLRLLKKLDFDSLRLGAASTNLAAGWDAILAQEERGDLSGMVLISDGGDNAGEDPLKSAGQAGTPIFTVGLGDTAAIQDAAIASWLAEPQIYRGKETALTVRIKGHGMEGRAGSLKLSTDDGRTLAEKTFRIPPDQLETEIGLKFVPDRSGAIPLHLSLSTEAKEINEENNQRALILNVAERQKNLLMIRGRPNFETMFLQRMLENLEDFKIRVADAAARENLEGDWGQADVLLLVGFPDSSIPADFRERLKRAYRSRPLPIWAWIGSAAGASFLKELANNVPFDIIPAGPSGQAQAVPAGFYAELDPDAKSEESVLWRDLPPLDLSGLTVKITGAASPLINLTDLETGAPAGVALLSWESGGHRLAATFGSGYWRWGFLTLGTGGSDEIYANFLKRLLHWLAIAPGQRPLRITTDRNLYSAGETVRFEASVLGGEGRPISSARVEVTLQGPALTKITLEPDAAGRYQGEFSPETIGSYSYQGLALWEGDTLGADSGSLIVESYNIEKETLSQNRALLEAIARASGGAYVSKDSLAALAQIIPAHPRHKNVGWSRRFFLNWDFWGLIIGLLALEWIIRKRRGML